MLSTNFLRSRWLPYLVMAIALGGASPAIGRLIDFADPAARHGLLYWWFMGIPVEVDLLVWPPEEYRYLLWATVFTFQYFTVFAAGALLVLFIQRRAAKKDRRPFAQPPAQQRAFETATALYNRLDSW
jgi:hypothetical protein